MTNPRSLQRYKTLHHEEGAKIIERSSTDSKAEVVLDHNGTKVEIEGDSDRFINAVNNIGESVRDGERIFVDLEGTAAGDIGTYQDTMELFETDLDNPIEKTTQRINEGKLHPPEDIDFKSGIRAVLRGDVSEKNLQQIVQHYQESLAIRRSNFLKQKNLVKDFRRNVAYNPDKFDGFYLDTNRILAESMETKSVTEAVEFILGFRTDGDFMTERWLDQKKLKQQEWDSIRSSPPDVSDSDTLVRLRDKKRRDGSHSNETAKLPAKIAIPRILRQYADLFELSREPLQDMTAALKPHASFDLSDHSTVIEFLDGNQKQSFTEPIVPDLRHGPSHASVELDDERDVVRVYNSRQKDSGTSTEVSYAEVPQYYYAMVDLLGALAHGILLTEQRILLSYLRSDEFKCAVAENTGPSDFQ